MQLKTSKVLQTHTHNHNHNHNQIQTHTPELLVVSGFFMLSFSRTERGAYLEPPQRCCHASHPSVWPRGQPPRHQFGPAKRGARAPPQQQSHSLPWRPSPKPSQHAQSQRPQRTIVRCLCRAEQSRGCFVCARTNTRISKRLEAPHHFAVFVLVNSTYCLL